MHQININYNVVTLKLYADVSVRSVYILCAVPI